MSEMSAASGSAHSGLYHCPICSQATRNGAFGLVKHLMVRHIEEDFEEEAAGPPQAAAEAEVKSEPAEPPDEEPSDDADADADADAGSMIKCGYCKQLLPTFEAFIRHVQQTHPLKMLPEAAAPAPASPRAKRARRARRREPQPPKRRPKQPRSVSLKCTLCPERFGKASELAHHFKAAHGFQAEEEEEEMRSGEEAAEAAAIECVYCPMELSSVEARDEHMRREHHHQPNQFLFKCLPCLQGFHTEEELLAHNASKHPDQLAKCLHCLRGFAEPQELARHHGEAHAGQQLRYCRLCRAEEAQAGHKCEHCGKAFADEDKMRAHNEIMHRGMRLLKCPECDKTFYTENLRNLHLETEHGKKKENASV